MIWGRSIPASQEIIGISLTLFSLGKTVQTLARIVEGRPTKKDREDGWAAGTLFVSPPLQLTF